MAEALWAIKVACSDFSFESCKNLVPLFQTMFEGSPAADKMQLSERKVSYVISHGLGPYFHDETISDLKAAISNGGFFTLSYDETTTSQIKKQMDLYVRYWSPYSDQVVTSYLTSLFLGHADADIILKNIMKALQADSLPVTKVLTLSMDGPNVNLLVVKKLNEELEKMGRNKLIDIDTCCLHKVHNCFAKALDTLPLNIDEFASDLFSFFKQSAARREDLKNLQQLLECEEKYLLRHVNSRWLTLGPVVKRILSIYSSLEEYFLKFVPKQRGFILKNNCRYERIVNILNDPKTKVYLEFIVALTPSLNRFLSTFQSEGPLIHLLYSEMNTLVKNVLLKFIKKECLEALEGEKLATVNVEDFKLYKNLKHLEVGVGTKKAIAILEAKDIKDVKMALRSCLVKLAKHLQEKLPLKNQLLKDLEIFHPIMRNAHSNNNVIQRLCCNLKILQMQDHDIDIVLSERCLN